SATRTAAGPLVGFGLEFPWRDRNAFFVQGTVRAAFPDENLDGRANDGFGSFDLLTTLGAGLKFGLAPAARPPQVLTVDGPAQLDLSQPGTFTADVAGGATRPVEYRWDWGDGESATGLTATHSFGVAGSYTVRFTASNRAGASSAEHEVVVVRPVQGPRITNITSDPDNPDVGMSVRFTADVIGTEPLTYEWSFGDGGTASGASAAHTFDAADLYSVTLTVSNEGGSDTQVLPLRVADNRECSQVIELNSVFFQRNSSTLSAEGRSSAEENAQYLDACPNVQVRIEGWAAPGERNPSELSADRARAVAEYYRSRDVNPRRMTTIGMGRSLGNTSKKEGGAQNQRVDTIPLQ
ncbi:MAG TPA: PKD domain-containing protein, partial [Rhodothermales bacterium]|nr:PKD domain-containing protein [Rhodothermales bacterium]